jgi:hypothetical protein
MTYEEFAIQTTKRGIVCIAISGRSKEYPTGLVYNIDYWGQIIAVTFE